MKESRYRIYLLTILAVVFCLNTVDGIATGLFLQEIKRDLDLSDAQLGLMTGIAFAIFYSIMGIPLARRADRGNRVRILAVTTVLWSVALAACGAARSFVQLLLIRAGVAIGEAGCIPVAHSLIAEHFPRAERPRAVALFLLGGSVSQLIGYFVAGWLNVIYGWRVAYVLLGLPGIPLAALALLTLREPRAEKWRILNGNSRTGGDLHPSRTSPRMAYVLRSMCRVRAFRHLLLGIAINSFFFYGIVRWQPAFFIRSYGMSTYEVGAWFGAILGGGTIIGTFLSGEWPTRLAPRDEQRQLVISGIIFCCLSPISAGIYLANDHRVAFLFMAVNAVGISSTFGPLFGTVPMLVPEHMRAMAIALVYLFVNLIGLGLGPVTVGGLSDALHTMFGGESLRYALLLMTPGFLWGAWHLRCASRHVDEDIARAPYVGSVEYFNRSSRESDADAV